MNRKRFNITFFTSIVVLVTVSLIFGFWKSSTDEKENYSGIGPSVVVSPDDQTIIFPYYRNQTAGIYQADLNGKNVDALTYPESGYDLHPQFSPDGSKVVYIHRSEVDGEEPKQSLNIIEITGDKPIQLTGEDYFVSKAVFSNDSKKIYFLNAGIYTNYSPITGPRPHEFDVYEMNVDGTGIKRLTNYKNYGMSDLTLSADGKSLYFQMMNDEKIKEPEDTFEAYNEIYKYSIEKETKEFSFVPAGEFGWDEVYGIAFSKDEKLLAYSAVTLESKDEKFYKYELFLTDLETKSTAQITNLNSYAAEPVFFHHSDQLLFLQQYNWPGKPEKFQLWKMNIDGTGKEKIVIDL